jgi:SAM-dependent methyltransferase
MYRKLQKNVHACDVLAVSDSGALACAMTFSDSDITETTYPDVDICALPYKDGAFDMMVSDQVLEHVREPKKAVAESVRVTRLGGLIVHTTCCVNPIHGRPDHWRFTPSGLALLVPDNAKLLEVGGWGNPLVWLVVALGAQFVPVPHAKWHPLHWLATWNHPDWPVVVWLVMEKVSTSSE